MLKIFIMSFVFIYLVLSAQFEASLILLLFYLLFLYMRRIVCALGEWGTFSLYSQIGIVTLVGLISKHGILITKFINDLREQGVPLVKRFSMVLPFVCVRF